MGQRAKELRRRSREQREQVWSKPESNAGMGWIPATKRDYCPPEKDESFDEDGCPEELDFEKEH